MHKRDAIIPIMVLSSLLFLTACKDSYEDKVSGIESYFAKGKTGPLPDYFLVNDTETAGPAKIAVIFGTDNRDFCNDIAKLYMKKYTLSHYYCIPANK